MIESGLMAFITQDPTCSFLISNRIYLPNLPENPVLPAVTIRLVSTTEQYTMDGPMNLIQVRIQLDSWGTVYKDAKAVSVALRTLLNSYTGTLPNGCQVTDIRRDGEQSGYDEYVEHPYIQTDWIILYSE